MDCTTAGSFQVEEQQHRMKYQSNACAGLDRISIMIMGIYFIEFTEVVKGSFSEVEIQLFNKIIKHDYLCFFTEYLKVLS